MTELKERARKQREELEKRMMGDADDDDDDDDKEAEGGEQDGGRRKTSNDDSGCSWGMGESFTLQGCSTVAVQRATPLLSGWIECRTLFFGFALYSFFLYNPREQLKKPFQRRTRTRKTPFQRSSARTRKLPT